MKFERAAFLFLVVGSISLFALLNLSRAFPPRRCPEDNTASGFLVSSWRSEFQKALNTIGTLDKNRLEWENAYKELARRVGDSSNPGMVNGVGCPDCPPRMEPNLIRNALVSDVEVWANRAKKAPTYEELYHQVFNSDWTAEGNVFKSFVNPYQKQSHMDYPHSSIWLKGDQVIDRVIEELKPQTINFIVEAGSMHGGSAIRMATELDKHGLREVPILCIDPWTVNVRAFIEGGMSDKHIVPFAVSSIVGARWLQATNFQPNLIYLDSAHEEDETYVELCLYWDILAPGGILMGDDYGWLAVKNDVDRFVADRNLKLNFFGVFYNWWIQKEEVAK
eukprot:GEMP01067683.1.p1 GENE.GEMP01067683.1~~GEMP01067683.1.p1  ORF type:complete len:335 (+),score=56.52 GEMP01067683.1:109-1113(+)